MPTGKILAKAYQLSKGNPIQDTKELLTQLKAFVTDQGASSRSRASARPGYAADVLEECVKSDVNIVETVAHMLSSVHFFGDVDVICDIGGQDIKVLFMKNGDIANFRLSNSCSAGNGTLLQGDGRLVRRPGQRLRRRRLQGGARAEVHVRLRRSSSRPIASTSRRRASRREMLAGLAQVLPKNVWQYVVQIPRLRVARPQVRPPGRHAVQPRRGQGAGRLHQGARPERRGLRHPHTGEAGAIGAAMETLRVVKRKGKASFIGLDQAIDLDYTTKNDEETVCHFCPNECKRTFIDTKTPGRPSSRYIAGLLLREGHRREQGGDARPRRRPEEDRAAVPEHGRLRGEARVHALLRCRAAAGRGLADQGHRGEEGASSASAASRSRVPFRALEQGGAGDAPPHAHRHPARSQLSTRPRRSSGRISKRSGSRSRTSSSPTRRPKRCGSRAASTARSTRAIPSKVAQAHIHNLIFHQHTAKKPLKYIFFPILTHVTNFVADTMDNASCPIVAGAPDVMKAAFTKEVDFFATRGIEYLDPAISFMEPNLMAKRLFETFGPRLGITEDENDHACREAWRAQTIFENDLQDKGRAILETVEDEDRVAILLIGRPYHSDPGLNHGIPEEFQVLGYPVLSVRSIPKTREYLDKYFKEDLDKGVMKTPLELNHVWPENYSVNSAQKVWGAVFAAHHPNVVVLDLSSFKCGHDAPIYGLVDSIIEKSKTPYAALHDIDANKPGGSIKIRVKTYAHALKLHEERLQDASKRKHELEHRLDQKRLELLELKGAQMESRRVQDQALRQQIETLREKVRAYQPRNPSPTVPLASDGSPGSGVVTLGKKNKDGTISRVRTSDAGDPKGIGDTAVNAAE
jgi:predicted nucleotide-binding protein (sugar kinase/HSP70/actin superfamily)